METNNGLYNQKRTPMQEFFHSCLGRIVIAVVAVTAILFLAHISIPPDEEFTQKVNENIQICIKENTLMKSDIIDDIVRNTTAIFTTTGKNQDSTIMSDFNKYNKLVIHRHAFYSTARIYNNKKMEGTRSCIGIFGIVIPTVTYNDMVLSVEPLRKEYDQKLIQNDSEDEDQSEDSDFEESLYPYGDPGSMD
ncbi:MAG: hypothetical protein ACI4TW_06770 [Prevotella sp.]